jgi:hypothetical protein
VQALQCAIAIQTTLNAQPDGLRLRIGAQGRLEDLFSQHVRFRDPVLAAR